MRQQGSELLRLQNAAGVGDKKLTSNLLEALQTKPAGQGEDLHDVVHMQAILEKAFALLDEVGHVEAIRGDDEREQGRHTLPFWRRRIKPSGVDKLQDSLKGLRRQSVEGDLVLGCFAQGDGQHRAKHLRAGGKHQLVDLEGPLADMDDEVCERIRLPHRCKAVRKDRRRLLLCCELVGAAFGVRLRLRCSLVDVRAKRAEAIARRVQPEA
mmetsp:Transcript_5357/g.21212  ORF Transcript_5357/g.21212 Transcript_5357/m.21212 type:complete len:211 (+) Transcript_5357:2520-3152(+)